MQIDKRITLDASRACRNHRPNTNKILLTTLFLLVASLGSPLPASPEGAPHWGYTGEIGPENWHQLSPDFGLCKTGQTQTPINIAGASAADLPPLALDYQQQKLQILNNGHTIQVNSTSEQYARLQDREFKLLQFHFHTPSENLVDGSPYPAEIHFVHKDAQGSLAVIALFVSEGKENPLIKKIWQHLPAKEGPAADQALEFNPRDLLPQRSAYYYFQGSLTTPPCSEGVHWQVL
ncbi:MAG: carbonic anhydrase family protein, partial [Leptospiraceae bacterium]|nr:carbonic anhydrase family protein [Leptospiraceae bacterium]